MLRSGKIVFGNDTPMRAYLRKHVIDWTVSLYGAFFGERLYCGHN